MLCYFESSIFGREKLREVQVLMNSKLNYNFKNVSASSVICALQRKKIIHDDDHSKKY